jgi:hypothetical protein
MNRGVRSYEHSSADQTGLGLAPKTPAYRLAGFDPLEAQIKSPQHVYYCLGIKIADAQNIGAVSFGVQIPDSWMSTTRTRSSTIASRSSSPSFSLPRTRVSSQV